MSNPGQKKRPLLKMRPPLRLSASHEFACYALHRRIKVVKSEVLTERLMAS